MIPLKQNLQVATAVLAVVNTILNDDDQVDRFHVEAYSNGREQGYHIRGWADDIGCEGLGISFSENRNSDHIVVYTGKSSSFSMQGNVPQEGVYKNAKYFEYGEYYKAASFIVEKMREYLQTAISSNTQEAQTIS